MISRFIAGMNHSEMEKMDTRRSTLEIIRFINSLIIMKKIGEKSTILLLAFSDVTLEDVTFSYTKEWEYSAKNIRAKVQIT